MLDPLAPPLPDPQELTVLWPDGSRSAALTGEPWMEAARRAGQTIPTACRVGSCGACEIEVNGLVIRACITTVPACPGRTLTLNVAVDPYW